MPALELLGRLARVADRAQGAKALARELGAEDLLLFVRDGELDILLPAPGFPQVLRERATWTVLLEESVRTGSGHGRVPWANNGENKAASAFRLSDGSVLVTIGGAVDADALRPLLPVFPLLSAAVAGELAASAAVAQSRLAADAQERARILTRSLEKSGGRVSQELHRANEAHALLQKQAEELREQTAALRLAADQLSESHEELEVLNEELTEANAQLAAEGAEAERARGEAEEANRVKSDFLAMMSHELRTPLNAIGGYASLLELGIVGPVTPEQRKYIDRIKWSQTHLSTLINDVLNFAQVEAGKLEYHIASVSLDAQLKGLGVLIEPQAIARDVTYEFRPGARDVAVCGDRDKIAQVVLNLLTNAVKFTPPGGTVLLHTEATPTAVLTRVTDSGPGIPADRLESIFEPFVQLERSLSQDTEGVGLGLTISRELARGMRGELIAESQPGRGATFTFTLPRA